MVSALHALQLRAHLNYEQFTPRHPLKNHLSRHQECFHMEVDRTT